MNGASETLEPSNPSWRVSMLKALGDPIRWSLVQKVSEVGELPCRVLEEALSISKATVSHHEKILIQADILRARKEGRYVYYSLQPENVRLLAEDLWRIAPYPRPVEDGTDKRVTPIVLYRRGKHTPAAEHGPEAPAAESAIILTW